MIDSASRRGKEFAGVELRMEQGRAGATRSLREVHSCCLLVQILEESPLQFFWQKSEESGH
jgi:hypothetical protein